MSTVDQSRKVSNDHTINITGGRNIKFETHSRCPSAGVGVSELGQCKRPHIHLFCGQQRQCMHHSLTSLTRLKSLVVTTEW